MSEKCCGKCAKWWPIDDEDLGSCQHEYPSGTQHQASFNLMPMWDHEGTDCPCFEAKAAMGETR